MKLKKTMFALALGGVGVMQGMNVHAGNLNAGDRLTIGSGSFFAVDMDADSIVDATEKTALSQGLYGIVIGAVTAPGAITAPWSFLGEPGYDWVSGTPVSGGTGGLDMSGWMVTWNNGTEVPLGTGAWQVLNASSGMPTSGYANGTGIFSWSGVYGDAYTLDYTATPQDGAFTGVQWALHLEGTAVAVPEASTYGMMLAGLGLVSVAAAKRWKRATV